VVKSEIKKSTSNIAAITHYTAIIILKLLYTSSTNHRYLIANIDRYTEI